MICARCGTEHNDPEKICPRCFYGRPKFRIKLPKWFFWMLGGIGAVAVIAGITLFILSAVRINVRKQWIEGTWENDEMALIITRDDRFHLINGQNVLVGEYELNDEELRLISEDGKHYLYYYDLEDELTLNISYADGQRFVRETLIKLDYGTVE